MSHAQSEVSCTLYPLPQDYAPTESRIVASPWNSAHVLADATAPVYEPPASANEPLAYANEPCDDPNVLTEPSAPTHEACDDPNVPPTLYRPAATTVQSGSSLQARCRAVCEAWDARVDVTHWGTRVREPCLILDLHGPGPVALLCGPTSPASAAAPSTVTERSTARSHVHISREPTSGDVIAASASAAIASAHAAFGRWYAPRRSKPPAPPVPLAVQDDHCTHSSGGSAFPVLLMPEAAAAAAAAAEAADQAAAEAAEARALELRAEDERQRRAREDEDEAESQRRYRAALTAQSIADGPERTLILRILDVDPLPPKLLAAHGINIEDLTQCGVTKTMLMSQLTYTLYELVEILGLRRDSAQALGMTRRDLCLLATADELADPAQRAVIQRAIPDLRLPSPRDTG